MDKILDEVIEKYGEYIEMIPPDDQGHLIISLLCQMIQKERDMNEYLNKRLQYAERK